MMQPAQQELLLQRLKELSEFVDELEQYTQITLREYLKNQPHRRQVERMMQIVVESAIDTNSLLIKALQKPPADHASQSFERLFEMKIIGRRLAERFQEYVSLRNDLVHRYRETKDAELWSSARELVRDTRFYIRNVQQYVESQEE